MKKAFCILTILCLFASCENKNTNSSNANSATTAPASVSQFRDHPSPQPVATHSENVTSETGRLNNWKFSVALYETAKTFTYRLQIQYAELSITDSLQLPDLGTAPKPVFQKGKEKYTCIIGFMDNKNIFREYKSVTVTNGNVRIHTLKYYAVSRTTPVQ
jgi:hypothetical protein